MSNDTPTFTFTTLNTVYTVFTLGFGLMEVKRAVKGGAKDGLPGIDSIIADEVLVTPAREDGHILEDRVVVFKRNGITVLRTSYADSRAYNLFPWGTYEDGRMRQYVRI